MSDYEVERAMGYTPCICGVLDGTWHSECYKGKTTEQVNAGYIKAFAKARRYLKSKQIEAANIAINSAKAGQ